MPMKLLFSICGLLLLACKNDKYEPEVLALKEMGDLATVEYTITKIIKANDNNTWYKIGERKILMTSEAVIKAGIDMESVTKKNFTIDGKDIAVKLPNPKIISMSIPAEKIRVEYQDVTLFRQPFKASERDDLLRQAEKQIRAGIDSLGILEQARINTSLFVTHFLQRLGYENIDISYHTPEVKKPI